MVIEGLAYRGLYMHIFAYKFLRFDATHEIDHAKPKRSF